MFLFLCYNIFQSSTTAPCSDSGPHGHGQGADRCRVSQGRMDVFSLPALPGHLLPSSTTLPTDSREWRPTMALLKAYANGLPPDIWCGTNSGLFHLWNGLKIPSPEWDRAAPDAFPPYCPIYHFRFMLGWIGGCFAPWAFAALHIRCISNA